MAHINLYLKPDLEKLLRTMAKKQKKSMSAFLTALLEERLKFKKRDKGWVKKFAGAWQGDFPEVNDPLPSNEDSL